MKALVYIVERKNALWERMSNTDIEKGTLMVKKSPYGDHFGLYADANENALYLEGQYHPTQLGDSVYDSIVINGYAPFDIHFSVDGLVVAATNYLDFKLKKVTKIPQWFLVRFTKRDGQIKSVDLDENMEIVKTNEWDTITDVLATNARIDYSTNEVDKIILKNAKQCLSDLGVDPNSKQYAQLQYDLRYSMYQEVRNLIQK